MTLADIENMTFADLKAKRAEAIDAAKKSNAADVAERYVQARADAKQRDETLASQGATITALNQGLAAATEKVNALGGQVKELAAQLEAAGMKEAEMLALTANIRDESAKALADLKAKLAAETARAERLKAMATVHHAAIAEIGKLSHNALAAQAIETADKG